MSVIEFATARPVIVKRTKDRIARLYRLETAFYLKGDAYHERAERLFVAAGWPRYKFKLGAMPKDTPPEVLRLIKTGNCYAVKSCKLHCRAVGLERDLYGAQINIEPKGVA